MKYNQIILVYSSIVLVLCGSIAGCASSSAMTPYSSTCLMTMKQAREYAADGRYELAREHYVMALAASGGSDATETITAELHAVDLIIKSQR